MPTVVQFRRGTTAQNDTFTGAVGEISVDTQKNTIRVHDGSNAGGYEIQRTDTAFDSADVRGLFSASGDLSYNSSTGEFSFDVETVYTKDNFDSDLGLALSTDAVTTTDLTEGSNLYYTDTRARQAVSVTDAGGDGSLAYNSSNGTFTYTGPSASEARAHFSAGGDLDYNSSTGVISFTERTDAEVRGLVSATNAGGDGSLAYNSTTGVFTYTGPSASEVRAHFSAGTGVAIASGEVSIGQAVGTTDDVTFNDVTVDGSLTSDDITSANVTATGNIIVQGDLTVNGTTTTINSTTVSVNDKNLVLADSAADATAANGAGITIDGANATLTYASVGDKWVSNKDFDAPNFNSTSDRRLKDNIQVINNALNKVNSINGVTFDWKESGKTSMGVIAQDVEKVAPEVISETNGYKAVNYDGLIGLLIESIKELKEEIEALK